MNDAEKENRLDKYNFIINLFKTHIKRINSEEIKLAKYTKTDVVKVKKTLKKQYRPRKIFGIFSRKKSKMK